MSVWAMIQNGVVINMVIAAESDAKDPTYAWVDVAGIEPTPVIGVSYDGAHFSIPPTPPADVSEDPQV